MLAHTGPLKLTGLFSLFHSYVFFFFGVVIAYFFLPLELLALFLFSKTFRLSHFTRTLVLLSTAVLLAFLLGRSHAVLHGEFHHHTMNGNDSNHNADPASHPQLTVQPMGPGDLERMQAEANERWKNRPQPVQSADGDPKFIEKELHVCRLPNGGVSESARRQLEHNRLRREEEARLKAAQQEPHEQHHAEKL